MKLSFDLLYIVGFVILLALLIFILAAFRKTYNSFVLMKERVEKSWGFLEDSFKKRLREVNRLIQLSETYITGHCESFIQLKSFSRRFTLAPSRKELLVVNKEFSKVMQTFVKDAQSIPQLQEHQYYNSIINTITHINADIDKERADYNMHAEELNNMITKYPFALFAQCGMVQPYEYFTELKDKQKITDVKFDF